MELKATFHIEQSLGLGGHTRITKALTDNVQNRFEDLIRGTSLSFTLRKDGENIINEASFREFVASIVFYLVMFNAIVFIGEKDTGYGLFASQRKIYNNDYIRGLYARDEVSTIRLGDVGDQIYAIWHTQWNREGRTEVWHFEDCWPIFLLDDARGLITFFRDKFHIDINPLHN